MYNAAFFVVIDFTGDFGMGRKTDLYIPLKKYLKEFIFKMLHQKKKWQWQEILE